MKLIFPASRVYGCIVLAARRVVIKTSSLNLSSLTSAVCLRPDENNMKKPFERLPKTVVPVNYNIVLTPDLKECVFDGKLVVELEVKTTTSTVVTNSKSIAVKEIEYTPEGGTPVKPSSFELSDEDELLTIKFPKCLDVGKGSLSFTYTGTLNDDLKGFYRSKYSGPNGEQRYAAVTQFEASGARCCFPCWDEPAVKATFDISLHIPENRIAISNMPIESEEPNGDGLQAVKFQRTPIMSSYLVGIIVGEYDFVEDKTSDGVVVRVYTPLGCREQGKFALEVSTKVLPYYKDYFQIAYPLPKMDLVAIADMASGAMENWGILTFREKFLLVDPENSSQENKQNVAAIVGHEIAHMWFGNLVTPDWWDDLWLKEGYATFVQNMCVNYVYPEYDIWTQFVTNFLITALELDSLKSSHPIEVPVGNPKEVDEIFDDISYDKGASVIRMLHNYIGDEDFRKGMHLYLKRHSYGNAETVNLWNALEEASKKKVASVMSTWTKQTGFPIVSVSSEQVGKDRKLQISQTRFFSDDTEGDDSLWQIPLSFSTASRPTKAVQTYLMVDRTAEVIIKDVPASEWVKLNVGTVGYYRLEYSPEMLNQLLPAIREKSLQPLDRLGLFDDLYARVHAGRASTAELLKVLEYFQDEDDFTVWNRINSCLAQVAFLLQGTNLEASFKAYCRRLFHGIMKRLGWEGESSEPHVTKMLRSIVIGRLAWSGDEEVTKEAKRRFNLHITNKQPISPDLRLSVFRAALLDGDSQTFEALLKMYGEIELQEERNRIGRSLGATPDPALLKRVLEFAISDKVRLQDQVFVILPVSLTKEGRDLAWNFIKDNWKELSERYEGAGYIRYLIKGSMGNCSTLEAAEEVETFFKKNPSAGSERAIDQTIEKIRVNAAWISRDKAEIEKFLSQSKCVPISI